MNKPQRKNLSAARPSFICGAMLFLATVVVAQYALDANLRVGSGGRNSSRPRQVKMNRPLYKVSSTGNMRYSAGNATGSTEVYDSAIHRRGGRTDVFDPPTSRQRRSTASALARPSYTPNRQARATTRPSTGIPTIQSRSRPKSSSSLQRSGYNPSRSLNAMQAPSLNLSKQAYSASGTASSTIRSR